MDNFLLSIDLALSDFLLLAIILILFYALNLIEFLSISKEKNESYQAINLRFLNSVSFIGIILTIGSGIVAQYYHNQIIDSVLLLVPIAFISLWAFYHHQYSNSIDFNNIKFRIRAIIKDELIEYSNAKKQFTFEELQKEYHEIVTIEKITRRVILIENRPIKFVVRNLESIFEPFKFNRTDIEQLLQELCHKDHILEYDIDNSIYFLKSLSKIK